MDFKKPLSVGNIERFWSTLPYEPRVIVIAGKKGEGKTALAMYMLERIHEAYPERKCYTVGVDAKTPDWIDNMEGVENIQDEAENNSVVFVNEGGIQLSSASSGGAIRQITKIMEVARHKKMIIIVDLKNTALLNVNVIRNVDTFIMKKPSMMQGMFERDKIKGMFNIARDQFKKIYRILEKKGMSIDEMKVEMKSYFMMMDEEYFGVGKAPLPKFWTNEISTNWAKKI